MAVSEKIEVDHVQVLRYMGNKRAILPFIIGSLNHTGVVKPGETILDLFSGTHAVGYGFKSRFRILANDIQEYSWIIGKALIENNRYTSVSNEDLKIIEKFAILNYSHLLKMKYTFRGGYSDRSQKNHPVNKYYIKNNKRFPYCLFSYYFSNKFFSLDTCMWIDSFRYAIDKLFEFDNDEYKKCVFLNNLMYAVNATVFSTGHFAQYLNKGSQVEYVNKLKIWDIFFEKNTSIEIVKSKYNNKVFQKNYLDLLADPKMKKELSKVSLVYMDPPYSEANYSRYYHIPETLVKYDYPESSSKGCYRSDRHFSNFSSRKNAESEMVRAVKAISHLSPNVKLAISYSNNGIIPVRRIQRICRKYFKSVKSPKVEYRHSSLGTAVSKVNEILIICRNPKQDGKSS